MEWQLALIRQYLRGYYTELIGEPIAEEHIVNVPMQTILSIINNVSYSGVYMHRDNLPNIAVTYTFIINDVEMVFNVVQLVGTDHVSVNGEIQVVVTPEDFQNFQNRRNMERFKFLRF